MSFKRLRFWIVFGIVALLAVATFTFVETDAYWRLRGYQLPGAHEALTIGTTTVQVVRVSEEKDRQRGLSGTDGLAPDEGMLFVYEKEGQYAFWMKDMRYSIDILWITASSTVAGLWEDAAPESYPRAYAPKAQAQYVLELPAGWAATHGVKIGDTVGF